MKRDKIIQIISHSREIGTNEETGEKQYKNSIWGLTETGAIYEWIENKAEVGDVWDFVTLSPEDE